jgi:hypothetical protein
MYFQIPLTLLAEKNVESATFNFYVETNMITSDLDNGYDYAIFSIPRYGQVQDQNRLLRIQGASAPDLEDASIKPYLKVVPEPAAWGLVLGGPALLLVMRRRTR